MNKYLATLRVHGQSVKTIVFADSTVHAKLLLQYQFGMSSVLIAPVRTTEDSHALMLLDNTANHQSTPSPEQMRIATLKKSKDKAVKNLAAERKRQQVTKAQKKLSALQHPQIKPPSVP